MSVAEKYRQLTQTLIRRGLTVSTMESCTAGLVATLLTDTEGASAIMKGAFVTYCNEAKIMQGVPEETIRTYGVYSAETAETMAAACARTYGADIGIGITGSLGRCDPANQDSVPGEVYAAIQWGETVMALHWEDIYGETRSQSKQMIAERIADSLLMSLR